MAGVFEQDDTENWGEITRALRGPIARQLWLQYKMGMDVLPDKDWPLPVKAYSMTSFSELNERCFYKRWLDLVAST